MADEGKKVGTVTHFYDKIGVAVLDLSGDLAVEIPLVGKRAPRGHQGRGKHKQGKQEKEAHAAPARRGSERLFGYKRALDVWIHSPLV